MSPTDKVPIGHRTPDEKPSYFSSNSVRVMFVISEISAATRVTMKLSARYANLQFMILSVPERCQYWFHGWCDMVAIWTEMKLPKLQKLD